MFKHAVQILNDGDLSNKVIFVYVVGQNEIQVKMIST